MFSYLLFFFRLYRPVVPGIRVVVAGAVLISALVSLTLTPVLNVKLSGGLAHHGKFYKSTEPFFSGLDNVYRKMLGWFMGRKWISFAILTICAILIVVLSKIVKSELAPLEDHSIIRVTLTSPEGTGFYYMDDLLDRVNDTITKEVPEARLIFTRSGGFWQ